MILPLLSVVTSSPSMAQVAASQPLSPASSPTREPEHSYWVHASLGDTLLHGYWGPELPPDAPPNHDEINQAARLLTGPYGANRLYLIYHHEIPLDDAEKVFLDWRSACPVEVDLVPTLVLRMYDRKQTPVFTADELRRLSIFCRDRLKATHIGIYDVYPNRDQEQQISLLEKGFPHRLIRVGIQPDENISARYEWVVQDTWSGLCHGRTNEDWLSPGFGAETLRKWIAFRANAPRPTPVSWDLIVVAWDYASTERGGYPGYDDAKKNMPLPTGRNRLAFCEIAEKSPPDRWKGVSSDLFILHVNSRTLPHDGPRNSFYKTLKRGEVYAGYYAIPFNEIVGLYQELRRTSHHAVCTTHQSAPQKRITHE